MLRIVALLAALTLPTMSLAEIIEGKVTSVGDQGGVEISLHRGARVNEGDPVTLLAHIPGLGLTAITTTWRIDRIDGLTVFASPEEAPTGAPQPGYIAQIDSSAQIGEPSETVPPAVTGADGHMPDIPFKPVDPSPAAENLYLSAENLMSDGKFGEAAPLLRQAARQYHGHAMSELGALYAFGKGVPQRRDAALAWQELAAKYGEPDAYLRLGLMHMTGQDGAANIPLGSEMLHKAAAYGSAQAMYLLALLYEDGTGVPADEGEMVTWLRESADYGYGPAQLVIGQLFLDGDAGVTRDRVTALDYLTRAAENGQVEAMNVLADELRQDNPAQARRWSDAARNAPRGAGTDAQCLHGWECYGTDGAAMPAAQPAPAPARTTAAVQDCDRLAAHPYDTDRPDPSLGLGYDQLDAARALAACEAAIARWPDSRRFYANLARAQHKMGQPDQAFATAMKAADMGSAQGMAFVAALYRGGVGVAQDSAKALHWFERSAQAGNIAAMIFAAGMRIDDQSPLYDAARAAQWYKAAADAGNADGIANLGVLCNNGEGVAYDPVKAATLLVTAFARGSGKAGQELLIDHAGLSRDTRIEVQRILQRQGRYTGAIDGAFGPVTLRALRSLQP